MLRSGRAINSLCLQADDSSAAIYATQKAAPHADKLLVTSSTGCSVGAQAPVSLARANVML
eukprot:4459116-Pleurochrysis_carterae.AAC.1